MEMEFPASKPSMPMTTIRMNHYWIWEKEKKDTKPIQFSMNVLRDRWNVYFIKKKSIEIILIQIRIVGQIAIQIKINIVRPTEPG